MTYICKPYKRNPSVVSEIKSVLHPPINKVKEIIDSPFGGIRVMERTGKFDKSQFWIYAKPVGNFTVTASRDGIKEKLRIIRPEEQKLLDGIEAELQALHERKIETLKLAWSKGHVIPLQEIESRVAGATA